ncbi:MAG: hypothetical protein AB1540_07755 [Bdellovibrionota bacterium]
MTVPPKPLLKASDFKNFEYSVLLSNTTTKTDLLDSARIRIIEISDRGLVLKAPKSVCSEGHMLELFIFPAKAGVRLPFAPHGKKVPGMFSITGKTKSVTPDGDRNQRIDVEFYQFDEWEWKDFISCFQNRQARVDKIIKAIQE